MFNIFRSKPPNIFISELGEFKYHKDTSDEYWECVAPIKIPSQSVDIDFCAIEGTPSGAVLQAKDLAVELICNPDKLWRHIGQEFLESAGEDVSGLTKSGVKDFFFIKSFTCKDANSYEIGFHCKSADVFIELFIRNGAVAEVHKDYGCCAP